MPRMVLGNPRFARRLVYTRAPTRITIWILDATRIIASVISSDDGRKTDVRARERPKKRADGCQKYYADKIFMVIGTHDRDQLYFPRWIEMAALATTHGTQIPPFSSLRTAKKRCRSRSAIPLSAVCGNNYWNILFFTFCKELFIIGLY